MAKQDVGGRGRAGKLDDAAIGQNAQRLTVGAGVVLGLLAVVGTSLSQVPLQLPVLLLALALLTVLTQLATAAFGNPSPEALRRRHADRLRMLLNAWPETTIADVSPYLIGVRSPGADIAGVDDKPKYVERDLDAQLAAAVKTARVVLLVGPPCAGKSRTACHALKACERTKGAVILAPDDAAALEEVLRSPKCVLKPGERYVLWLDDLERYLSGLHLRELDSFIDAQALAEREQDGSLVTVMATMREHEFLRVLDEGGDTAHVLRGIVARAERFVLSGTLSSKELEQVLAVYPEAPRGESFAHIFSADAAQRGHVRVTAQPRPTAERGRKHPLKRIGKLSKAGYKAVISPRGSVFAVVLAVVLAAALVSVGVGGGWTTPPPMAERLQTLLTSEEPCGGAGVSPHDAAGVRSDVVRVIRRADGCPISDIVEIFNKQDGTLADKPAASFYLSSRHNFRCIGPDRVDPCHVDIVGSKRVILGMWQEPVTGDRVPVAFYKHDHNAYEPAAVALTAPVAATLSESRPADRSFAKPAQIVVLERSSRQGWPIAGTLLSAAAIVPPRGDEGAVLVGGYVVGGTLAVPELVARGFELGHVEGRVLVTRICDGAGKNDLRIRVRDEGTVGAVLRQRWSRALNAGKLRCRELYGG